MISSGTLRTLREFWSSFGMLPLPPTGPEPVTLGTLKRQIEQLRTVWLLGGGDEEDAATGLDPLAEQNYLLAIGALEQAQRFATLADLHQARALGEQRSTR